MQLASLQPAIGRRAQSLRRHLNSSEPACEPVCIDETAGMRCASTRRDCFSFLTRMNAPTSVKPLAAARGLCSSTSTCRLHAVLEQFSETSGLASFLLARL